MQPCCLHLSMCLCFWSALPLKLSFGEASRQASRPVSGFKLTIGPRQVLVVLPLPVYRSLDQSDSSGSRTAPGSSMFNDSSSKVGCWRFGHTLRTCAATQPVQPSLCARWCSAQPAFPPEARGASQKASQTIDLIQDVSLCTLPGRVHRLAAHLQMCLLQ
jgi:hypothetical protein